MRVAVLIPNRNHAEVLGRAIQSAKHQSMQPCCITVLDDASTDESVAVAKSYGVTVIEREQKSDCWIKSLGDEVASIDAEYIVWLGADDVLYWRCVEKLVGAACMRPGVVFSNWQRMTYGGTPYETVESGVPDSTYAIGLDAWARICRPLQHASGIGSMIRKDVLQWLFACGFDELGAWCDSTGYTAAALVHGAAWTSYVGAGFTHSGMPHQSYHLAAQANPDARARAMAAAFRFLERAGLQSHASGIVGYWFKQ